MIHFGVITARRPRPTLLDSIISLRCADFCDEVLVCSDDPGLSWVAEGCELLRNEKPLGNLRNWTRCLRCLVDRSSDGDWICVCEDDITWVRHCRSALERDLRDLSISSCLRQAGALSLYFPIAMSSIIEKDGSPLNDGWHASTRGIKTWGAQCLLFTKKMAIDLLSNQVFCTYLNDPKWTKNVDGVVAESLVKFGLNILYRVPCLVDHSLGEGNSSLGYADERPKLRTRYFRGSAT